MSKIKWIMALAIIFFLLPVLNSNAQGSRLASAEGTASIEGIADGPANYYRNLIIQDIALASRLSFGEVKFRLHYYLNYQLDSCEQNNYLLKINNIKIELSPVYYYGFDISSSMIPRQTELVFHLRNNHFLVLDSLVMPVQIYDNDSLIDSSVSLHVDAGEKGVTALLSKCLFNYDVINYENFRDKVLQIDEYYAASALADSTLYWIGNSHLSETYDINDLLIRQSELSKINDYINPVNFQSLFYDNHDPAGLITKYYKLRLINTRFSTLLESTADKKSNSTIPKPDYIIQSLLDWLDYYHQMAFHTDYRFVNFLEGMSTPGFTNSRLLSYYRKSMMLNELGCRELRQTGNMMYENLLDRGRLFEESGDQIRALSFYKAAMVLARLSHSDGPEDQAEMLACRMKKEIVNSYLEISKRTLERDNPAMAVQYLNYARDILAENNLPCLEKEIVKAYELSLFLIFIDRTPKKIEQGEFSKALSYLREMESFCMRPDNFICPEQFPLWMKAVQQGIYEGLLVKANKLIGLEEWAEAEQIFRQALETRLASGQLIDKSDEEDEIDTRFRQSRYDDLLEEGFRNMAREEFDIALYYFNKANLLNNKYLPIPDPNLILYRQSAANFSIRQLLPQINFRAISGDYDGASLLISQVDNMIIEYRIAGDDPLILEFRQLKDQIYASGCSNAMEVYEMLLGNIFSAREEHDYVKALQSAMEAIDYSMGHLECRIRDDQAWYQKIVLEPLAAYQEMEDQLVDQEDGSVLDYIDAYQELQKYYYRNKLLDQGVASVSLFNRVVSSDNVDFLNRMLVYFIDRGDYGHALHLLDKLRQLGVLVKRVKDHQRLLAASLAKRDAQQSAQVRPWELMESYTGKLVWYRPFKWRYKMVWLKDSNWNIRDWPLIWKK